MNVQELINYLETIPRNLQVRLLIPSLNEGDEENFWLEEVDVSFKGESGYEEDGEVRLYGES